MKELTAGQRAMVAAKMSNLTITQAAREVGSKRDSVQVSRVILRDGAPEVVAAIEAGELSLHTAKIIARMPRAEQAGALTKHLGIDKDAVGRRQTQGGTIKASPRLPLAHRMSRTLDQLENATELIEDFICEPGARDEADYQSWLLRVSKARRTLTLITKGGVSE